MVAERSETFPACGFAAEILHGAHDDCEIDDCEIDGGARDGGDIESDAVQGSAQRRPVNILSAQLCL